MNFLTQYALFALESVTFVMAMLLLVGGVLSLSRKAPPGLEITSLDKTFDDVKKITHKLVLGKKFKKKKKDKDPRPSRFVLDFTGDIAASQVTSLRDEISAILSIATPKDEVILRLESPGGSVNGYGLAASQLERLRDKHIPLTVCIDKVAASGGYLMACVADKIIAAPFAIIGSIGVVAQLPNVHRWLKKHDIDVELLTAGEYKRTLTVLGENTEKGRKKFQEDLEKIHTVFRNYVLSNRAQLDIEAVATGEHWLAKDAIDLALVDKLQTSDDYLQENNDKFGTFSIKIRQKQPWSVKILKPLSQLLHPWG